MSGESLAAFLPQSASDKKGQRKFLVAKRNDEAQVLIEVLRLIAIELRRCRPILIANILIILRVILAEAKTALTAIMAKLCMNDKERPRKQSYCASMGTSGLLLVFR